MNLSRIEVLLHKLYNNELTLSEAREVLRYVSHLEACLEDAPYERQQRRRNREDREGI